VNASGQNQRRGFVVRRRFSLCLPLRGVQSDFERSFTIDVARRAMKTLDPIGCAPVAGTRYGETLVKTATETLQSHVGITA